MSSILATAAAALTVAVGSKNPCKVEACRAAIAEAFPAATLAIHGYNVPSGVKDQPFGDEETKIGAGNRATAAAKAFAEEHGGSLPDFSVGLEGGVGPEANEGLSCFAYMCVLAAAGDGDRYAAISPAVNPSFARTAAFTLPPAVTDLMRSEKLELGDAGDKIFSRVNSKHHDGTVGILTGGIVDRSMYYRHALTLALIPFLPTNSWLYNPQQADDATAAAVEKAEGGDGVGVKRPAVDDLQKN